MFTNLINVPMIKDYLMFVFMSRSMMAIKTKILFLFYFLICVSFVLTKANEAESFWSVPRKIALKKKIYKKHQWLNTSPYYQKRSTGPTPDELFPNEVRKIIVPIDENETVIGYFFDRNASALVILFPYQSANPDQVVHFAAIFQEHDLLIVEYLPPMEPHSFANTLEQAIVEHASSRTHKIIQPIISEKHYAEVIGVSSCYGCWVLLQLFNHLAKTSKQIFNRLIIEKCPPSIFDEQWLIKHLTQITVPVLFFYDLDCIIVTNSQFKSFYDAVPHQKKYHICMPIKNQNFNLDHKELYREAVLQFLETIA